MLLLSYFFCRWPQTVLDNQLLGNVIKTSSRKSVHITPGSDYKVFFVCLDGHHVRISKQQGLGLGDRQHSKHDPHHSSFTTLCKFRGHRGGEMGRDKGCQNSYGGSPSICPFFVPDVNNQAQRWKTGWPQPNCANRLLYCAATGELRWIETKWGGVACFTSRSKMPGCGCMEEPGW